MAKSSQKKAQTSTRTRRASSAGGRSLVTAGRRSREPFAVTCDGIVYVNVNALGIRDAASLKGRKLFIGAELGQGELRMARSILENAGHELGAKIAGARAKRRRAATASEAT